MRHHAEDSKSRLLKIITIGYSAIPDCRSDSYVSNVHICYENYAGRKKSSTGNQPFKAVFRWQWGVFLRTFTYTYSQYASINEFTSFTGSEHSERYMQVYVGRKSAALEINPQGLLHLLFRVLRILRTAMERLRTE